MKTELSQKSLSWFLHVLLATVRPLVLGPGGCLYNLTIALVYIKHVRCIRFLSIYFIKKALLFSKVNI